jgi:N-acetylneuraminic acid mutarotase
VTAVPDWIYVVGGRTDTNSLGSRLVSKAWTVDPSWQSGPPLSTGRSGAGAVTLGWNGGIYVVGGVDTSESVNLRTLLFFP